MAEENKNAVRKTIYIDEKLFHECESMFREAGVISFSSFVSKAVQTYNDRLISENHSAFVSAELIKAIQNEVRPIASRLSISLYRYAVELDMLCQLYAYQELGLDERDAEMLRKLANKRVAKMRGKIDLKALLDDGWMLNENESEDMDD